MAPSLSFIFLLFITHWFVSTCPEGAEGLRSGFLSPDDDDDDDDDGRISPHSLTNLEGKVAFVAGVADNSGYGWAIAKTLYAEGATVLVGTWPPMYSQFVTKYEAGHFAEDQKLDGRNSFEIAKIYPLDAIYSTRAEIPQDVLSNRRYQAVLKNGLGFSIAEVVAEVKKEFGGIDLLVHSIANGPEVSKPLLATSRKGYLAALSSSAYSFVSMVQHFGPLFHPGGAAVSLTYIASERVIPGYGGGMSSAKAALESDTRTLAYEAGQSYGIRINTISAGPLKSRAASGIKNKADGTTFIDIMIDYSRKNAPLSRDLESRDVADAALFLLSPMARAVTGQTLYVDNGLHAMGVGPRAVLSTST